MQNEEIISRFFFGAKNIKNDNFYINHFRLLSARGEEIAIRLEDGSIYIKYYSDNDWAMLACNTIKSWARKQHMTSAFYDVSGSDLGRIISCVRSGKANSHKDVMIELL